MNNYQQIGIGTYKLEGDICVNIVKNGLNMGYKLIDTAQLYKNHENIRDGILLSDVNRSDIFITSKIHNKNIKKNVSKAIYDIKKELDTDYMDMILLHNPVKDFIDGYKDLIFSQHHLNITNIGVSNFTINDIDNINESFGFYPSFGQIEYNVFNQQTELIEHMFNNNMIVQSHTGLYRGKMFDNIELVDIKNSNDISIPDIMHKFILQNNIGIIPMTTNHEHLCNNFNINKSSELSTNTMMKLYTLNNNMSLFRKYLI